MKCVVLILAAGASSRFGSPKPLAKWRGGTLLSHAIETANHIGQPLIVLGGHAEVIGTELKETLTVYNPDWSEGLSTSIICGALRALAIAPDIEALIILPVDQPLITFAHLNRLFEASLNSGKCALTVDQSISGPPACVPKRFFPRLAELKGKQGLKAVIDSADCVTCEAFGMLADIDTQEDLVRLQ